MIAFARTAAGVRGQEIRVIPFGELSHFVEVPDVVVIAVFFNGRQEAARPAAAVSEMCQKVPHRIHRFGVLGRQQFVSVFHVTAKRIDIVGMIADRVDDGPVDVGFRSELVGPLGFPMFFSRLGVREILGVPTLQFARAAVDLAVAVTDENRVPLDRDKMADVAERPPRRFRRLRIG